MSLWTLLYHRIHRRAAERFWEAMRNGAAIEPVGPAGFGPNHRRAFTVVR